MKKILLSFFLYVGVVSAQYKNIQISDSNSTNPNEVTIAINPSDPRQVAAGANLNYFYSSSDSGKTWLQDTLRSLAFNVWGDPSVVYDNNGNLFFGHLSYPSTGHWIDRIVIQKSTDNGSTWNDSVAIGFSQSPIAQDKEWLAVDYSNSNYRNNIYLAWTEFDNYGSSEISDSSRILFSHSTDEGENWTNPIRVSDIGGNCVDEDSTVEGAVPTVGPNGEVYISWAGPLGIMFDKSTNGGKTFGKDIFVTSQPNGWAFDIPGIDRCNGMPITACDISNSQYNGNVYINWSDQRNGENNTDIFFIKSTDKGETWSEVIKVNDDATTRHQFLTWMDVDPKTGFIYIVFYDRRNTIGNKTEVYLARSKDGGDTFKNYKISETIFEPNNKIFFGDYINISVYNGMVRPIWMRMDNNDRSVWTALINEKDLITNLNNPKVISSYQLFQNYPNPFNPTTTISYSIPLLESLPATSQPVQLKVYNVLGEEVATLVNKAKTSGIHEVTFDAGNLVSGIYIYKITVGNYSDFRKMIVLK